MKEELAKGPGQWNFNFRAPAIKPRLLYLEMKISSASTGLWMPMELALEP